MKIMIDIPEELYKDIQEIGGYYDWKRSFRSRT
jgi:hypothetical protein